MWSDEASIAQKFPVKDKCGNLPVPIHIKGFSPYLKETFPKIEQYRNMSLEQQEVEQAKWRNLGRAEQNLYKERVEGFHQMHLQFKKKREDRMAAFHSNRKLEKFQSMPRQQRC